MDWLLPCAFWTSCCPHHLNDDGASSLYVSSQSADDSVPPLLSRLSGCTWNFYLSYGNLQEVETVSSESSANSNQEKKRKGKNKKQTKKAHSSWHVLQNDMLWHEVEKLENSIPAYWRTRILLFWLHLILESQFGSILYILLISFEVVFSVFPP